MSANLTLLYVVAATMKKMWADGGITGMFKGNMATMLKVMPQSAVQFAVSLGGRTAAVAACMCG